MDLVSEINVYIIMRMEFIPVPFIIVITANVNNFVSIIENTLFLIPYHTRALDHKL